MSETRRRAACAGIALLTSIVSAKPAAAEANAMSDGATIGRSRWTARNGTTRLPSNASPQHEDLVPRSSTSTPLQYDEPHGFDDTPTGHALACHDLPQTHDDCGPETLAHVHSMAESHDCAPAWIRAYHESCTQLYEDREQRKDRLDAQDSACQGRLHTVRVPPGFLVWGTDTRHPGAEPATIGMVGDQLDLQDMQSDWEAMTYCEEPYDFTSTSYVSGSSSLASQSQALGTYGSAVRVGLTRDADGQLLLVDAAPAHIATRAHALPSEGPVHRAPSQLQIRATDNRAHALDDVLDLRHAELDRFMSGVAPPGYDAQDYDMAAQVRADFVSQVTGPADRRQAWEDNGAAIWSCDEYAYEKFYRYSKYEDLSAMLGVDYRMQFDVAFGTGQAHLVDPDGTAAIAHGNVLGRKEPIPSGYDPDNATVVVDENSTFVDLIDIYSNLVASGGQSSPKNAFFSVRLPESGFSRVPGMDKTLFDAASREEFVAACGGLQSIAELEECLMSNTGPHSTMGSILLEGVVLLDNALHERVTSAIEVEAGLRVNHDLQWHAQMADQLEAMGFSDEQLYVYDDLKAELQRLLDRRRAIEALFVAGSSRISVENLEHIPREDPRDAPDPRELLDPRGALDGLVLERLVRQARSGWRLRAGSAGLRELRARLLIETGGSAHGDDIIWLREAPLSRSGFDTAVATLNQAFGISPDMLFIQDPKPRSMAAATNNLRRASDFHAEAAGWQGTGFGSADPRPGEMSELLQLYFLDRSIEEVLRKGATAGCYDLNTSPCDWSPKLFVQSLSFKVAPRREQAKDECVRITGGVPFEDVSDFDPSMACGKTLRDLYDPGYTSLFPPWRDIITTHTQRFDEFLVRRQSACIAAGQQAYRQVRSLQNDGLGNTQDESKGNSILTASYSFDVGYSVDMLAQHLSGFTRGVEGDLPIITAGFEGTFDSEATLFNHRLELLYVHGSGTASDTGQYSTASVRVGGEAMYEYDSRTDDEGDGKGTVITMSLFELKHRFTIGPVPVAVTAGMTGSMGVAFDGGVRWETHSTTEGDSSNPEGSTSVSNDLALVALFAPHASLDLYATAAVDVYVAAVGVRADLTVISMALPTTVSLRVAGKETAQGGKLNTEDLDLSFRTQMDANLTFLDGSLGLFAKVGAWKLAKTYRKKLFDWSGPRFDAQVFSFDGKELSGGEVQIQDFRAESFIPDPSLWHDPSAWEDIPDEDWGGVPMPEDLDEEEEEP